ncbi:hypothetical protein Tco_1514044 [Tanacetum coccineum]
MAICAVDMPVVFKAPKTSSKAESVSQGTKPRAKSGHKKLSTSLKQPSVSSREATKGGSSKAPTSSKTSHSKKIKESSSAMDLNPSQLPVSTLVDTRMHKEDQQATGGPTSLRVTSEARATLSSVVSASENDASAASTTEADLVKSAPRASSIARHVEEEEASSIIKLKDLAKMVSKVQPSFKDLDSPGDDPVIVVDDSDEDVHTTTEDTSVLKSLSPSLLLIELKDLPSKLNELTGEVKGLKKQVYKLEIELPGDLKEIPTKLDDFTKNVTRLTSQVDELKILK